MVVPAARPEPGLVPVEIFDGGRSVHFGNPIVEVRDPPVRAMAAGADARPPGHDPESLKPYSDPIRHPAAFREQTDAIARELAPRPERPSGTQGESGTGDAGNGGQGGGKNETPASESQNPSEVVVAQPRYADLAPQDARRRALDDSTSLAGQSVVNADTGWPILVTRRGLRKSLSSGEPGQRAEIVANLKPLLETGQHLSTRPGGGKPHDAVVAVHKFGAVLDLDGRRIGVTMTVRETGDGIRRHYAIDDAEISPEVLLATGSPESGRTERPSGPDRNIDASASKSEFGPAQAQVEALRRLPEDTLFPDPLTGTPTTIKGARREIERQARAVERLRGCAEGGGG
jgi:hypothetical protein